MIKKKTWLIGAVAGLAAAGVLAVSQPAITSAVANETEVSTAAQKGIFNIGHRLETLGGLLGFGGGVKGGNPEAISQLLNMEQADLLTELKAGKSLLDIAKDKGISEQTLIDTIKAQINSTIDEKVKQGYLTEDQAKELKTTLDEEHIKGDLERVPMAGGKGAGFGGRGGFRGNPELN